jgi:hypothetical protein
VKEPFLLNTHEEIRTADLTEEVLEEEPQGYRRKFHWRLLEDILVVLALGAGMYLLVPRFLGDREMVAILSSHTNYLVIPLCLVVETISMLSICYLYYQVLRIGGETLSFGRTAKIYMSAYAFGHIVPGANAGTFYLNYRELRNEGISRSSVIKTLAVSNITYSASLLLLLVAGILLSLMTGRLPFTLNVSAIVIGGGSILFVLLCIFLYRRPALLVRMSAALMRLVRRMGFAREIDFDAIPGQVEETRSYISSIVHSRRNLARTAVPAVSFWLFDLICLYIVFLGIGHPINPGILMVSYIFADLLASIPTTPAGLGVFEVTLGASLYAFGVSKEALTIGILGFRFFSFWLPIPAGGICYLLLRTDRRREERNGKIPTEANGARSS